MMSHNIAQCLTSVNEMSPRLSSNCSVAIAIPDLSGRGNLIPLHEIASADFVNLVMTKKERLSARDFRIWSLYYG